MFLDLIQNNMVYNVKLANILGINYSIYIASLGKLLGKNMEDRLVGSDCWFKLDPRYITKLSGLKPKEQEEMNVSLEKIHIIEFDQKREKIKFNSDLIITMIGENNRSNLKTMKEIFNAPPEKPKRLTNRQIICNNLKKGVVSNIPELLEPYQKWVEGVYANPNGFLSNQSIKIFQDTIENYSKGNLNLALELINIATVSGYRDATWAINVYEERNKSNQMVNQQIKPKNIILNNSEVF